MPTIAKGVIAPAFNADVPVLSFRYNNWRVIMNKQEIMVKDITTEADAVEVMGFLQAIISEADRTAGKAKTR
jgi:hypothetical protein